MANEIRLRSNSLTGTITDNPLTSGATTINSAGFASLPTVTASNSLALILDPLGVGGTPEIVLVTAHTAAATSVTVLRGQEGSIARSMVFGTTWDHGPTVADYNFTDRAALSTNRPASPFAGQMIYETDTKRLQVYNGTDWNPNQAGGQLGYAEKTATNQTGISAITDLTGITVTVTVGTNRRIKVTGHCGVQQITGAGTGEITIREAAVSLARGYRTLATNDFATLDPVYISTPSVGSHTYKLSMATTANTINTVYGTDNPAFILVEDIGAA